MPSIRGSINSFYDDDSGRVSYASASIYRNNSISEALIEREQHKQMEQ